MEKYIVFVKTDDLSRIIAVQSSAFLPDPTGWTEIDRGTGDRFHHAQGNYLPMQLTDERGIYRYRLQYGQPVERTQEEMDADYTQTETTDANARLNALEEAVSAIEEGAANV